MECCPRCTRWVRCWELDRVHAELQCPAASSTTALPEFNFHPVDAFGANNVHGVNEAMSWEELLTDRTLLGTYPTHEALLEHANRLQAECV